MNDRKTKFSIILKEMAANFIQHEANNDPLITVTSVDVAPDLKRAIIFVTTIPDTGEEEALVFLKRNGSEFRNYLKSKARLKNIPHIDFMIDAGERHRQHMDRISAEIKATENSSETNAE
jgi:ribosome-binding factor A